MIKKTLLFIVEPLIILIVVISLLSMVEYIETHYTREATVIYTNDNNEVVVSDKAGNEWHFYGIGYVEGDAVKMKMFTNYTDSNIYDDEIVNVKIVK